MNAVVSVVFAGLGGQGVLTASHILAKAAFDEGYDVKASELHGMAQRGGSVTSDVRYGQHVLSPMIAFGEADYVVALDATQVEYARRWQSAQGVLITPNLLSNVTLESKRSTNIALLGILVTHLALSLEALEMAIRSRLPSELHTTSVRLFRQMAEKGGRLS